jgi:hypothetical protein
MASLSNRRLDVTELGRGLRVLECLATHPAYEPLVKPTLAAESAK